MPRRGQSSTQSETEWSEVEGWVPSGLDLPVSASGTRYWPRPPGLDQYLIQLIGNRYWPDDSSLTRLSIMAHGPL